MKIKIEQTEIQRDIHGSRLTTTPFWDQRVENIFIHDIQLTNDNPNLEVDTELNILKIPSEQIGTKIKKWDINGIGNMHEESSYSSTVPQASDIQGSNQIMEELFVFKYIYHRIMETESNKELKNIIICKYNTSLGALKQIE